MNTDIDPLSRWLDGHATEAQTDALVRAVEEDPAALQSLVEVSLMEAGLRQHLQECEATARPLSLPPVWHWKRAGRWIAAAGSLAAAGVAAWLFLSPPGNASAPDAALADATAGKMKIRRVPAGTGERAKIPGGSVHPGMTAPTAPLVERSYRPSARVLAMLKGAATEEMWAGPGRLRKQRQSLYDIFHGIDRSQGAGDYVESAVSRVPDMRSDWESPDERLGRFLRGSGVEFTEGSAGSWQGANEVRLTLTESGHERAANVLAATAEKPYPGVIISASYYGTDPPPQLEGDRVLTPAEMEADDVLRALAAFQYDPDTGDVAEARRAVMWPEMQCQLKLTGDETLPDPYATPDRFHGKIANLTVTFNLWRTGDHYVLRGIIGIPANEDGNPPLNASEVEFDVTLTAGDHAVIHLDDCQFAGDAPPEKHFLLIGLKPEALSQEQLIDQWLTRQRDADLLGDRPMEATIRSKAGTVSCEVHRTAEGIEIRLPQGPILAFSTANRKWVRKDEAGREIQGSNLIPGTDLACEELVPATWPWLHWTKRRFRGEESVKTRNCAVFDVIAPDDAGPFRTVRLWATQERKGRVIRSLDVFMRMIGYDRRGDRISDVAVKSLMRTGEAIVPREVAFSTYAEGSRKEVSETTVMWKALPVAEDK